MTDYRHPDRYYIDSSGYIFFEIFISWFTRISKVF